MVQETIKIQADVKDAVKKISELTKAVEKLGDENAGNEHVGRSGSKKSADDIVRRIFIGKISIEAQHCKCN